MDEPLEGNESAYAQRLTLEDGTITWRGLSREELLCMVSETNQQPSPGVRGPKPVPWTLRYQRLEQMRRWRDKIRSKGDAVTQTVLCQRLGLPADDRKKLLRWLEDVPMMWEAFLAE